MKKITLEDEYGVYAIETTQCPVTIGQIFDTLIIPALLAAGFSDGTINDFLDVESRWTRPASKWARPSIRRRAARWRWR